MKFNDYQITQGEISQRKQNEYESERSARLTAEELRDEYRASLDRIRNASVLLPAVPTLSGLKEFVETIKEIVSGSQERGD